MCIIIYFSRGKHLPHFPVIHGNPVQFNCATVAAKSLIIFANLSFSGSSAKQYVTANSCKSSKFCISNPNVFAHICNSLVKLVSKTPQPSVWNMYSLFNYIAYEKEDICPLHK